MNIIKMEGFGYEWDASLIGGPADGCVDRVVQINGEKFPPKIFKKILDGEEPKRETIGEKLIEYWTSGSLDEQQKIAVYELEGKPEDVSDDICKYKYVETLSFKEFKKKYN
jgi:hypothetical protein